MSNTPHRAYPVTDRSQMAFVKREVHATAMSLGFLAARLGVVDLIVAELLSNLIKYAQAGELLVRSIHDPAHTGLELISVDSGPGMADARRMMGDGVSTGGSLGHGLGAISRLADLFELYSLPGRGTVGLVQIHQKPRQVMAPSVITVGAVVVPKTNETACGDNYFCQLTAHSLRLFLGDGLGHGPAAEQAVQRAIQTLEPLRSPDPAAWLRAIHDATTGTRGLVGTAARFDLEKQVWILCGVGNIQTQLAGTEQIKNYLPQNGVLGYNMPRTLQEQTFSGATGQRLVMTSDGIQTRCRSARYPGIDHYHPTVLAAALYKEFARFTDDMSVVVARLN